MVVVKVNQVSGREQRASPEREGWGPFFLGMTRIEDWGFREPLLADGDVW